MVVTIPGKQIKASNFKIKFKVMKKLGILLFLTSLLKNSITTLKNQICVLKKREKGEAKNELSEIKIGFLGVYLGLLFFFKTCMWGKYCILEHKFKKMLDLFEQNDNNNQEKFFAICNFTCLKIVWMVSWKLIYSFKTKTNQLSTLRCAHQRCDKLIVNSPLVRHTLNLYWTNLFSHLCS